MSATSSPIPFTGFPFPKSEYHKRQQNVLKAMEGAKLDALLVTAHHHLRYLTGYNGQGGYFRPFPLILTPGRAPTYVVRKYDELAVRAESCIDNIVPYTHQTDFAKVCADVLRGYGLRAGKIGLQLGCWNLAPADVTALQAQLPDIIVADATRLVPSLMAVKSELELKAMREAMAMTDIAVRTFQASLRVDLTEVEMAKIISDEVARAGGELWTSSTNILFGERTRLPHGLPTRNPIKNNEPAFMEIGGAKYGYASGIVRCAVLGRHSEAESLHALSVEALDAAIAAIRSGVTAGAVDTAARKVIERSGRPRAFRHRTGYQTGIHWGGRGNLSLEPGAEDILEAGMTLHMPVILFGESGRLIGCSEQVLVTDRGAEILGTTPHTLFCR
ncbi:M24 family metallopeptidase [Bradyrhizobium yuanmingense]|uniref:M24 family metallopeptidase n=1 Tax=Bradyrhizobium yuanmingense TaxID=108015 RepID=UPI0023B8DA30|nr:Xaa-Pro peptidase family protein [Bradyrhizobium yuanmingense]MDF0498637.1 Xaa-Pro peptidase family protein [Bradyrhizobium yuanmingense]